VPFAWTHFEQERYKI
jgi:hypothetical protein